MRRCPSLSQWLKLPTILQKAPFILGCLSNYKNGFLIKWGCQCETTLFLLCRFMQTEHQATDHSTHIRNRHNTFHHLRLETIAQEWKEGECDQIASDEMVSCGCCVHLPNALVQCENIKWFRSRSKRIILTFPLASPRYIHNLFKIKEEAHSSSDEWKVGIRSNNVQFSTRRVSLFYLAGVR